MSTSVRERLQELLCYLNHGLVERDSALKAALLTLLAGENLLLIGPPGTAKSLIARKVAACLSQDEVAEQSGGYFEYLLTKFSTPEEIFGPLSISELKADRFKRNTAGYLPSVRVAFLDEIFKASSSILNSLLTILNERLYHNGAEAQKVQLQTLIAASNELPTGQEELDALYDRFLVRCFVDYVSEDNLPRLLDKSGAAPTFTPLSTAELIAIRQAAEVVTLPADIVSAIQKIWAGHKQLFKEDRRESLSDRRLRKVVGLLRVSAATNGRAEVDLSDLLLLKDCLWNHPDNAHKVKELVLDTIRRQLPSTERQAAYIDPNATKDTIATHPVAKMGAAIKGYKGSGTELDPILIETLHDLAGLERPEIGQKNYWFRQVADIDGRELTTGLKIDFQGHFDGCGHAIVYRGNKQFYLFERVHGSHLFNLRLNGISLAGEVNTSEIRACTSDKSLLGAAYYCEINACQSGNFLTRSATKCSISSCQAETNLILETASSCNIQDCHVQSTLNVGRIATTLDKSSVVERCFVSGGVL